MIEYHFGRLIDHVHMRVADLRGEQALLQRRT